MSEPALGDWIGRRETAHDLIPSSACLRMAATLDRAPLDAGQALPMPWHWMAFLPDARQSVLGEDGHPRRGGFLPPVELPRRMWAAGRLRQLAPVPVDRPLRRESEIVEVKDKDGRSGRLVFVTVRHTIRDAAGVGLLEEWQDIVYRDAPVPGQAAPAGEPAPPDATWKRRVDPDPALLFRFSALTFNGHRIHYDRPYATSVEGYPGLVVHGPLLATLLLDGLRHEGGVSEAPAWFEFRAMRPVFDGAPFWVCGRPSDDGVHALWIEDAQGMLCMRATAGLFGERVA
ncbi:MAG: acyl-CoA dehydrogenase [Burkholderiaceae bacterium]